MIIIRLLATFCVAIATFGVAHADFSGLVVRVSDGDTIKVRDRCANVRTVRMLGIDAPEKDQAHGLASKEALSTMVSGKRVKVISGKRDKYGRDLGKVLLDKQDVNYRQVQAGNAWHYSYYQADQSAVDQLAYKSAQDKAQAAQVGLWAEERMPPWEWRRR